VKTRSISPVLVVISLFTLSLAFSTPKATIAAPQAQQIVLQNPICGQFHSFSEPSTGFNVFTILDSAGSHATGMSSSFAANPTRQMKDGLLYQLILAKVIDIDPVDTPYGRLTQVIEGAEGVSLVNACPGASSPPPVSPSMPPPVQIDFRADTTALVQGNCTTLRWDVDNIKAVYLDGQPTIGHSSQQVCPQSTTTYTLRVVTDGGDLNRTVTVNVDASRTASIDFRVDQDAVELGGCTMLRWDVDNVKAVYLDGQGVTGHGTQQICPSATQTYVLRVATDNGDVSRTQTVTVVVPTIAPLLPQPGRSCAYGQAVITAPLSGQVLSGTVPVYGTALCNGFAYYKFEFVDPRCSPTGLCFVAGRFTRPVTNGLLMKWDTTKTQNGQPLPNGPYRLRLTVVGVDSPKGNVLPQVSEITITIGNSIPPPAPPPPALGGTGVTSLTPPYKDCTTSASHTKSFPPKNFHNLKLGFSVAIAKCDAKAGTFNYRAFVFGGSEGGYDRNKPPQQRADSKAAVVVEYVPAFTGDLQVDANLTIKGNLRAGAGSGLVANIDVPDEIGKTLLLYFSLKKQY